MSESANQNCGPMSGEQLQREIDRCHREIAEIERQLRAGNPKVQGLCLALFDWSAELKILEALPWKLTWSDFLSPQERASLANPATARSNFNLQSAPALRQEPTD